MFDTDNSNSISKQEIHAFFSMGTEQQDESFVNDMIEEVDKDGNGEISFDEFKQMMGKMMSKI